MKIPPKVGNFPSKDRVLEHVYTGKQESIVVDEEQAKIVSNTTNTLLKGVHLLDTINEFTKDTFIPVPEEYPEIRRSVSVLDTNTPIGDRITFSFYKQLVNSIYLEIQELTVITIKDGKFIVPTDKTIESRISVKNGLDSWLLKLIMSGSSSLLVYLLHQAMAPLIAQDIAESTQPQYLNPAGIAMLQATGMLASKGLEELNKTLKKYGKQTIKSTTVTDMTASENNDPIETCWHSLLKESDKIQILEYVAEYLSNNYSTEYAPWLVYEDVYARVIVLYNRIKLLNPNIITISEISTVVEKHIYEDNLDDFIDNISTMYSDYSLDLSLEDSMAFRDEFDKIAASLSDYHYIQNAICCIFKYLLNINIDDVKRFRDFIALYRSTFNANSDFSNLRALEAFTTGIRAEISKIINSIRTDISNTVLDINGNVNETIACFSVQDFINIMLDFVDTLEADLLAFSEVVFNLYAGWELHLDKRVDFIADIKELDYYIGILDYIISAMARCEVENRDDPRAPYEINNYISNYINPTLKKFPRASFSDIVEPTQENSYQPGTTIVLRNKVYTIDREDLSMVDKQTYVTCQDKSSNYDSTFDI